MEYSIDGDADPKNAVTVSDLNYTVSAEATSVTFTLDTSKADPAPDDTSVVKVMAAIGSGEATELTASGEKYTCNPSEAEGNIAVAVTIETADVKGKALSAADLTVDAAKLANLTYGEQNLADTIKGAITEPMDMPKGTITYTFKKGSETAVETITTAGTYSVLASISGDAFCQVGFLILKNTGKH